MSVLDATVSGGRRKGPGGRWEVYASGQGWVPEESLSLDELAKLSEPPRAPQATQEPRQQQKAGKEPTARQREVWAAVVRHDGDQQAAADELGITQGGVSSGIRGYMKNTGTTERPWDGKPVKKAKPVPKHDPTPPEPVPSSDQQVAEPGADHASVLHPPVDENVEPVGSEDLREMFGGLHPAVAALAAEDEAEEEWYEAWLKDRRADAEQAAEVHRDGYARGYAVATLRALAATDGLPEQLRDMATDAADGLMA